MKTQTVVAICVVAVLLALTHYGTYRWGFSAAPKPGPPEIHTVQLPPIHDTLPAQIIREFVETPGSIVGEEDQLDGWRALATEAELKLTAALTELAKYRRLYAKVDTTRELTVLVTNDRDSVLIKNTLDRRLSIRYDYPPLNRFIIDEDAAQVKIPFNPPPPAPCTPEEMGFFETIWDAYKTGSAVVVSAEILYLIARAVFH